MMNMAPRIAMLAVAAFIIVGCANAPAQKAYWVRQNPSHNDLYECTRESAMVPRVPYPTPPAPAPISGSQGGVLQGFIEGSQRAANERAYQAAVEAAQNSENRAEQILRLCMQARGYRLEWRAE